MTKAETTANPRTAAVAEPGIHVAPQKTASKMAATPKRHAPKVRKAARKNEAKPKPAVKKQVKPLSKKAALQARQGSKKATILELLSRTQGATLGELAKATKWQNHSIRGFLSGTLGKKMGLTVESSRNQTGDRTYRLLK